MKDIERAQIILRNVSDTYTILNNMKKYVLNGIMAGLLEVKRKEEEELENEKS